jgi:hypothetical protein
VEFFTDGAAVLRSLTSYRSAESRHLLNWFHLTMRLMVMHQYARGVAQVNAAGRKALQDGLNSVKWYFWHVNTLSVRDFLIAAELSNSLASKGLHSALQRGE